MKKIQLKTNKYSFKNFFLIILLFFLIYYFIYTIHGLFIRRQETFKNKELSLKKIEELNQRKDKLISDIESLNSNNGQEVFFRENYGYATEGEQVFFIFEEDLNKENININNDKKDGFFLKLKTFLNI